jgi:hypothetical protein
MIHFTQKIKSCDFHLFVDKTKEDHGGSLDVIVVLEIQLTLQMFDLVIQGVDLFFDLEGLKDIVGRLHIHFCLPKMQFSDWFEFKELLKSFIERIELSSDISNSYFIFFFK